MLRYSPPKSSIWGHGLRKMKPSLQKERLNAFEKEAYASFNRYSFSLDIDYYDSNGHEDYKQFVKHFSARLNKPINLPELQREERFAKEAQEIEDLKNLLDKTKDEKELLNLKQCIKIQSNMLKIQKEYKDDKEDAYNLDLTEKEFYHALEALIEIEAYLKKTEAEFKSYPIY